MEVIESLQKRIIDLCTSKKVLDGELFLVEELDEVWKKDALEYMVNAVPEEKEFPNVAIEIGRASCRERVLRLV